MRAYKANMIPGGTTPTIDVSQYDNDYAVTVTLIEGAEIYTPPVGATIRVEGTKPDGHGFEYPCTYHGNVVTMPIYTQMTVLSGRFPIELVVYQNGLRVGSCNIIFAVEKATLGEDTDISETVIPDIIAGAQAQADAAAASATAAASSAASAVDSATAAAASATQAAASATSASASATTASSAATNAVSARDAAIEAAGDAETSSNAAATSESNAAASATAAATSESNAAASATAAAASATQAAASATAAASSAASAETAKDAAMDAAQDAIDAAQELQSLLVHDTASGAVASFADGADNIPMQSLVAEITPVQDLNGQANPYPAGGGKNLFYHTGDMSATVNGVTCTFNSDAQTITISGTNTGTASFILLNIPVTVDLPRETALCRAFIGAPSYVYIGFVYRKNGAWVGVNNGDVIPTEIDAGTTINIQVGILVSATTIPQTVMRVEIEKGSTAPTSYAPYSNVCPISGRTGLTVTRSGKNLYSRELSQYNVPVYAYDGTSAPYPDVAVWWINVKPNTQYIMTLKKATMTYYVRVVYCRSNKSFINRIMLNRDTGSDSIHTITTPADCRWLQIAVNQYDVNNLNKNDWEIQIEEGSVATEYEPYRGATYPITWESIAGTVYGGTLDVVSGVLTVEYEIAALENLTYIYDATIPRFVATTLRDRIVKPATITVTTAITSMYKAVSFTDLYQLSKENGTFAVADTGTISFINTEYTDAETFKTAMAGQTICYPLATPQTYQLTPIEVRTILGGNNIYTDAGDVSVEYIADTKMYIDNKIAELQALVLEN